MRTLPVIVVSLALSGAASAAHAFEICQTARDDPGALTEEIVATAVMRAPVKFHTAARAIAVTTAGADALLIPIAIDAQGTQAVIFPATFAKVACKIALASFLRLDGIGEVEFLDAVADAAECFDARRPRSTCLVGLADELERRYRDAFEATGADAQALASAIVQEVLDQVTLHEFAHHLLNHFGRMETGELSRLDAEFEADYFAIMNGVHAGRPPGAMFYFFNALADVETFTNTLDTELYESGHCRATNVENITGLVGAAPIVMLDAVFGGGYSLARNSPAVVESTRQEMFAEPPALDPQTCGKLAQVALGDAFDELKQLYERVARDAVFLFADTSELDEPRAVSLLSDLVAMSRRFRHMNGLAAKGAGVLLERYRLSGTATGRTAMIPVVAGLLEESAVGENAFLSGDFGNVLQAQGLDILQARTDLAPQVRLDRSMELLQRSVRYNPAQSGAWGNLAMAAFKTGDCTAAVEFAERSLATLASSEDPEPLTFFLKSMKAFAADPATCVEAAARFEPYPGL